jgi:hypothetical protein
MSMLHRRKIRIRNSKSCPYNGCELTVGDCTLHYRGLCKNCRKNVKDEYYYMCNKCHDYVCIKTNCLYRSELNSHWCTMHKCNICRWSKIDNSDYCHDHKCKYNDCHWSKNDNTDYCEVHNNQYFHIENDDIENDEIVIIASKKCVIHRCDEPRDDDSYCVRHNQKYTTGYKNHTKIIEENIKENIKENNDICSICRDKVSKDEQYIVIPCGHMPFHQNCLNQLQLHSRLCPICRGSISNNIKVHKQ